MSVPKRIYQFFPIQLLMLHFRKHQLLLVFWGLLLLVLFKQIGTEYGLSYLYLDPEYLGEVDFLSFSILGAAFGGFVMTWNIATYILNSHRFPFLAIFNRPFTVFALNNSILPLTFFIIYLVQLIRFQRQMEFTSEPEILFDVIGFVGGLFMVVFFTSLYFQRTNKNLFRMFKLEPDPVKKIRRKVKLRREDMMWEEVKTQKSDFPVSTYLSMTLRRRPIRSVQHYDESMLMKVFKQNHINAFIIQVLTLGLLLGLGMLIDYQMFRIPAGASALLGFAVLISFFGLLEFWTGDWKAIVAIFLLFCINYFLLNNKILHSPDRAFGVNYETTPAEYNYPRLIEMSDSSNTARDRLNTIKILERWKKETGEEKPKLVLMNFSGGGLSSALFSLAVIQKADSLTNGALLDHTVLMSGASGGMIGAAYLRELYLRKKSNKIVSFYREEYRQNISQDILNSVVVTGVTNDFLYPLQKTEIAGYTYRKNRGYIFEKQFNENTNFVMDKSLSEYEQLEAAGMIPMMIFTPTIINDSRKLIISTQPVSYLMRPVGKSYQPDYCNVDGVDFGALFNKQDAMNMKITTAVRMNATYPLVMPYVTLPSEPVIKVMDAGARDNYGIETSVRYVLNFKEWLLENTSGVILVQVRLFTKEREIEVSGYESLINRVFSPITSIYENMGNVQDFNQNTLLDVASDAMEGKLQIINFKYLPEKKEEETSLSFHLTTKEKQDIYKTMERQNIQNSLELLQDALEITPSSPVELHSPRDTSAETYLPAEQP